MTKKKVTPAPSRVPTTPSAADFVPKTSHLDELRQASQQCRGCELYAQATQTVFGEGVEAATVMLVGEQPGDVEDRVGWPFSGPAGQLLRDCLNETGIARDKLYITNAVKHFRWQPRGRFRLHQKPLTSHIKRCHPWLQAEADVIKPKLIVCLGAVAIQSVFGRTLTVVKHRGQILESPLCKHTLITYHPSALLRIPDPEAARNARADFLSDLSKITEYL